MLAARETKMLSAERMERMIDAPTNDEAAKILEECGYGDLSGLSAKEAGAALEAHIAALFDEVEGMVPEAQLVQLFRLKYDYHNAKALIKARAMGVECDAILSQRGTVAPQKLLTAFLEEDYRDIPPILAQAMVSAAAILARTTNPQAADFELDRAYFAQMLALSDGLSDGGFARGYVQLQIDSANLRAAVRTPHGQGRGLSQDCAHPGRHDRHGPRARGVRLGRGAHRALRQHVAGQCGGCRRGGHERRRADGV